MKKGTFNKLYIIATIIVLSTTLFSCKTSREIVSTAKLKPISTNKLFRNLENNAFDYDEMEIKRISCQYENNKQKTSFKGHLRAVNGEKILLTFNKINVPVGKLYLTPDSVKFVNYMEKNYFMNNYDYLSGLLNIDLDFETINAIISNNAFSYRNDKHNNDFREFTSEIDSGMYVLRSIKDRKLNKIIRKGKDKKVDRLLKKLDEDQLILQTLYIDGNFKLRKVVLDDQFNQRIATIDFSDFMQVGRQSYPGEINMSFISPEDQLKMKVKLSKLEMGKNMSFNFKVPDRYEQLK